MQAKKANLDCIEKISNLHIYFTLNAIFSYVTQFSPTVTLIVWDEKPDYRENQRKSEFKDYKDNRNKDLSPHQNNQAIQKLLSAIGIASIFPRDLEADDVISYICRWYLPDYKNIIISADRDFLQLIDSKTSLYDPIRKTTYCNFSFKEHTGYETTKDWLNAKCLLGDRSDNVPGIPKFTKRKADRFINGEIKLTEEESSIFQRNYDLFSLYRIDNMQNEQEYYTDQLRNHKKQDWKSFISECSAREFKNIIKKQEAWYSLFFLKNKLENIFV